MAAAVVVKAVVVRAVAVARVVVKARRRRRRLPLYTALHTAPAPAQEREPRDHPAETPVRV